jgi:hypothetical protein
MRSLNAVSVPLLLAIALLATGGCDRAPAASPRLPPIVGTWLVHDPNAPFPYHLYVFNSDGTMHQANPDAGDARSSDSDGKGAWLVRGDRVDGKWVELLADRATHHFTGRLEITFQLTVTGDSLTASEIAHVFDANGQLMPAPATPKPLTGKRVTVP